MDAGRSKESLEQTREQDQFNFAPVQVLAPDSPSESSEDMPSDPPLIITLDGPAGTGKSTVARLLANRLGLDFLDTGAMYRATAAIAIDHDLLEDFEAGQYAALLEKLVDADLHFDWTTDPPAMLAWLEPIDHRIREADVTRIVSRIAAIPTVRKHLAQKQRIIGHQHPRLVTEGRDQGSVVFPDAPMKFYLDAEPEIRAARRAEQLREMGRDADEAELLRMILERDESDRSRKDGPLVCPEDAVVIDTSEIDLEAVVDRLERLTRERLEAHYNYNF